MYNCNSTKTIRIRDDRKICPEDRLLASRDLPSDANGDSEVRGFLSHPHTNNGLLFI